MNPQDDADEYSFVVLTNKRSPGVATVTAQRKQKWDVQEAKGEDGGGIEYGGEPVAQGIVVEIFLYKDGEVDEFAAFEEWEKLLVKSVNDKEPKALDIYHPELARLGIKSVVYDTRDSMVLDGKGGGTVKITFIEYRKKKPKKGGKPKGSKANGGTKEPDPNQDLKDEAKALTDEFKSP